MSGKSTSFFTKSAEFLEMYKPTFINSNTLINIPNIEHKRIAKTAKLDYLTAKLLL